MTEPDHPDMSDELHWLAFRYVAGEMTDDEEERLELQLGDDQAAREAIALAVELHEAIRLVAAEAVPATRPLVRHTVRRRLAWAASLAALLMLSLIGLFRLASTKAPLLPADGGSAAEPSAEVARTWVEVRQGQHHENGAADAPPLVSPEFEVVDLEADASVPKWMMTAFAKQPKQK